MPRTITPSVDEYWAALQRHLPSYARDEQRAALVLSRTSQGRAARRTPLGASPQYLPAEDQAILRRASIKCLVYDDGQGRILGFGGLTATPMHHRLQVDGREFSTWCAWDSLFIPEILGRPALVASPGPETGEMVRLLVTPKRIDWVKPKEAAISFVRPDARLFTSSSANVIAGFCHYIFFFATRSSGERWTSKHPATFLFPLDDAFALAKRSNANNFGLELPL